MPPEPVCGPGIGLNLSGTGGGGGGVLEATAAYGEPAGLACNGHTARYGAVLAGPGASERGPGPTLMDDTEPPADDQPLAKRLHFADSSAWSP